MVIVHPSNPSHPSNRTFWSKKNWVTLWIFEKLERFPNPKDAWWDTMYLPSADKSFSGSSQFMLLVLRDGVKSDFRSSLDYGNFFSGLWIAFIPCFCRQMGPVRELIWKSARNFSRGSRKKPLLTLFWKSIAEIPHPL